MRKMCGFHRKVWVYHQYERPANVLHVGGVLLYSCNFSFSVIPWYSNGKNIKLEGGRELK